VAISAANLPPGRRGEGTIAFMPAAVPTDLAACSATSRRSGIYSYMLGRSANALPQGTQPAGGLVKAANKDPDQHMSLVVVVRSPIEKVAGLEGRTRLEDLRLVSDITRPNRDYFGLLPDGEEVPSFNVFTRRDGTVLISWAGEMTGQPPPLAKTPRGA